MYTIIMNGFGKTNQQQRTRNKLKPAQKKLTDKYLSIKIPCD